jgi:hypothetical protein
MMRLWVHTWMSWVARCPIPMVGLLNMKQVTAGETNGEEPRMGEFLRCGVRLLGTLISLGSRFRQCVGAKHLTDAPFAT